MHRMILLSLVALTLTACSSSQPATRTESTTPEATATERTPKEACVQTFARQRECTDVFIPALVDLRVRIDRPAGIAAAAEKEGRDALVKTALEEWSNDSQDPAIDATCERMLSGGMGDKQKAIADRCLATADCQAFTDCVLPEIEQMLLQQPPPQ